MKQRDDVSHFPTKLAQPFRIVILLLLLARGELGPHAVNQPDGMRWMREIPASQRGIEVRRMDRVKANCICPHLGDESDPSLIRAVIRGKLGRVLPRYRRTEVYCLD